ncbi:hypothetical protein HID58_049206 [Brassica napus]|uniref:Uncharacterized protein n=1 Tax=Brassica napus TaxID=3708 RepID=A0ABQ8B4M6_BRANA|nr:hypothetical protein HID58_049206 [Brassica napus]
MSMKESIGLVAVVGKITTVVAIKESATWHARRNGDSGGHRRNSYGGGHRRNGDGSSVRRTSDGGDSEETAKVVAVEDGVVSGPE